MLKDELWRCVLIVIGWLIFTTGVIYIFEIIFGARNLHKEYLYFFGAIVVAVVAFITNHKTTTTTLATVTMENENKISEERREIIRDKTQEAYSTIKELEDAYNLLHESYFAMTRKTRDNIAKVKLSENIQNSHYKLGGLIELYLPDYRATTFKEIEKLRIQLKSFAIMHDIVHDNMELYLNKKTPEDVIKMLLTNTSDKDSDLMDKLTKLSIDMIGKLNELKELIISHFRKSTFN